MRRAMVDKLSENERIESTQYLLSMQYDWEKVIQYKYYLCN